MLALKEFLEEVVTAVKTECELTDEAFELSHSELATNARVAVIELLVKDGWSEQEICKALGWKQQRVNWLKNHFGERMMRRGFRQMWERVQTKNTEQNMPGVKHFS